MEHSLGRRLRRGPAGPSDGKRRGEGRRGVRELAPLSRGAERGGRRLTRLRDSAWETQWWLQRPQTLPPAPTLPPPMPPPPWALLPACSSSSDTRPSVSVLSPQQGLSCCPGDRSRQQGPSGLGVWNEAELGAASGTTATLCPLLRPPAPPLPPTVPASTSSLSPPIAVACFWFVNPPNSNGLLDSKGQTPGPVTLLCLHVGSTTVLPP